MVPFLGAIGICPVIIVLSRAVGLRATGLLRLISSLKCNAVFGMGELIKTASQTQHNTSAQEQVGESWGSLKLPEMLNPNPLNPKP